ncbi:MAG: hypothetical protein A07HR60_01383 [uncultured archaeon A07HR60]|nr:MAG: hypothetical protein A07HR60_01383 [uncultured archaeon A07HR60]
MFFDINSKVSRMGRRRFLRAMSGLGVSGAALNHLSKEVVADTDLDEEVPRLGKLRHTNHEAVVKGEPPQREPIHYTISRDEWAVVETAHDAASQVNDLLKSASLEDEVSAGVTTVTRNHHDQKAVIVKRTVGGTADGNAIVPEPSTDEIKDMLPDTVSGTAGDGSYRRTIDEIPITVETERMTPPSQARQPTPEDTGPGNHYEHRYRPVSGGACIQWGSAIPFNHGTSCAPAYNEDAEQYDLVTAGHVNKSEEMHQPKDDIGDNHQIGTRIEDKNKVDYPGKKAPPSFDAGVVSLDVDHTYRFATDDGDNSYLDDHSIVGIVGRDKLKDHANGDFEIRHRGSTTGVNEGTLGDVYDDYSAYDITADCGGGDSGGPQFTREYHDELEFYQVYIAGVTYGGGLNRVRATMSDAVESEFNLQF